MPQQWLIILKDKTVFNTEWYDYENNWSDEYLMVIHLPHGKVSTDGKTFTDIQVDHL